jgi:hypothetical protein
MTGVVIAVIVVLVLLVVAAGAWFYGRQRRRGELQATFGQEYPRAVDQAGSRREAEKELLDRKERHARLDIRPLDRERREQYAAEWTAVQAKFVDAPERAVNEADTLVERVMDERGYPIGDFERRTADLSVEHADVLDHYRAAHDIRRRSGENAATTEQLREAMVHYRLLFESLLATEREATERETSDRDPAERQPYESR